MLGVLSASESLWDLPDLHDFRQIFEVIEARERTVQSIKCFLSSMGYIRGAHYALPVEGLRRGRAKLARLLGRLRMYSTSVVELIVLWRNHNEGAQIDRALGDPDLGTRCSTRQAARRAAQPFFWLGWNYLLKIQASLCCQCASMHLGCALPAC